MLNIPGGLSRPVDKGIQLILSVWVSNGLSMWSKCAEAIKAFGVVKGGPGMKNCRELTRQDHWTV